MDDALIVYKFLSLNDDVRRKRASRIFKERSIFFANASNFNDPFDCKFHISTEGSTEQWREYIANVLRQNGIGSDNIDLKHLTIEMQNQYAPTQEQITSAVNLTRDSVRVLSVSKKHDHILMWSHYSDCHRGICLELTFERGTMFYNNAREVSYEEAFPSLNFFETLKRPAENTSWLLRKHMDWKYEQEIRVLGPPSKTGLFEIPKNALTKVFLGSRVSDDNRRLVLSWVAANSPAIPAFAAREKPRDYGLDFIPINVNSS